MDKYNTKLHYHCDDWMNDPKPFFWNGEYHIFFQYKYPRHWGHIKSTDLLHWEELPVALVPGPEEVDAEGGCWTGCCIRAYDKFHIFYTGAGVGTRQTTCHAVSDDLITWKKDPDNPVIKSGPPYNYSEDSAWRDPAVWEHDGTWYMVQCAEIGSLKTATTGCIALMKSKDLVNWELMNPLHISDGMMMCECPDIFKLDGKFVGLFGCNKAFSIISDEMFGKYRLNPNISYLDDGIFYAGKTLLDDNNRRIMWGFLFENCGFEHYVDRWKDFLSDRNWCNALSFPRVLSLNEKSELASCLPEEFLSLRKKETDWALGKNRGYWNKTGTNSVKGLPENDFAHALFDNVKSDCFEITAKIKLNGAKKAGLLVRCNENLCNDVTGIYVCGQTNSVYIEDLLTGFEAPRTRMWDQFYRSPSISVSMPVTGGTDKEVALRVIVDVSVIEVYINDKACLTGRCYPEDRESLFAGLFSVSGEAVFEDIHIWELGL